MDSVSFCGVKVDTRNSGRLEVSASAVVPTAASAVDRVKPGSHRQEDSTSLRCCLGNGSVVRTGRPGAVLYRVVGEQTLQ